MTSTETKALMDGTAIERMSAVVRGRSRFKFTADEPTAGPDDDLGEAICASMYYWAPTVVDLVKAIAEGDVAGYHRAGRKLGQLGSNGWSIARVLVETTMTQAMEDAEDEIGAEWSSDLTESLVERIASSWGDEFSGVALAQSIEDTASEARTDFENMSYEHELVFTTRKAACVAGLVAGQPLASIWSLVLYTIDHMILRVFGACVVVGGDADPCVHLTDPEGLLEVS